MKTINMKPLVMAALFVGVTGCAATQPAWQSAELGSAVSSMIEGQIADPEAAANPREGIVESTEGAKTAAVIDAWRKSLAAPKETAGNVVVNIGK